MFESHKLNERGITEVGAFKTEIANVVRQALERMPEGRSKAIFLTKIEEAVFFGTKSIASRSENHTEFTEY